MKNTKTSPAKKQNTFNRYLDIAGQLTSILLIIFATW